MVNYIGALVQWRDGDTSVVWKVLWNIKNSKVASDKRENGWYYNAWKQGLGFILSLVQILSTMIR